MGNRWYVSLNGKELGPLSDTGLQRLIQGGRIEGDALVRNGQTGARTAAREIERLLDARPTRQRPGQEAIDAARAKRPLPRPPAPPSRIPPLQVTRSPAPTPAPVTAATDSSRDVAQESDALPAPDDLPLADSLAPEASRNDLPPAAGSSFSSAPVLPESGAAGPAAPTARRSPVVLVAAGVGAVLILAVYFAAGWFAQRGSALQAGSAPQSIPPPAGPQPLDPQLAALQQRAEQLRREMAEAKQKLETHLLPGAAPPAEQPAMPETSAKNESSAATDLPLADDSGAKPMASEPDAKPAPEPPAVGLEAERKRLGAMTATERAESDERERLRTFLEQFKEDIKLEFEPQIDVAYRKHLPEAMGEVENLGLEELSQRRDRIEQTRESRRKEAEKLLAETNRAAEDAQYYKAIEFAREYAMVADLDRMPEVVELLRELERTHPFTVLAILAGMPADKLRQIIADQKLPADWPTPARNPAATEAARKSAARLAPLALDLNGKPAHIEQLVESQDEIDLQRRRKLLFLQEAVKFYNAGELSALSVRRLIEIFGVFGIDDLTPLIDDVLATEGEREDDAAIRKGIEAIARGEIKPITLHELYGKCRDAAGDAWPRDDAPHPLAGRWKGQGNWELEIDPLRDAIVFSCSSPKATFEQRICKTGPNFLIAYEKRKFPPERISTDPFRAEKYNSNDRAPGADDPLPEQAVALTYYSLDQGGGALEIRRRLMPASFARESAVTAFWEFISTPKEYREYRSAYRRVKE